jgi:glycosyltransferase involved in cell wall biosynthesis
MPGDAMTGDPRRASLLPGVVFVVSHFNHHETVGAVVDAVAGYGCPVFVVDDGSDPPLEESVSRASNVTLLRHPENLGKGEALRTGFTAASAQAAWAIVIDADGQHDPAEAPTLAAAVADGQRAIVVGVRRREQMAVAHWTRRFGRHFSNFWVWSSGGPWLDDSQSGYRMYPLPEVMRLRTTASRYQFEVEILAVAHRCGIAIVQVPIDVTYAPPGGHVTHFRPFVDFWRNTAVFTRLIAKRLLLPGPLYRRYHVRRDGS